MVLFIPLSGKVLYSIQLATFVDKARASAELRNLEKKINHLFLYKTDRGYWTIRTEKKKRRDEVAKIQKNSKLKLVKKGIIVPSDIRKIELVKKKAPPPISQTEEKQKVSPHNNPSQKNKNKDSYEPIDTYTFCLRVGTRIYVVQFSDNPDSHIAKTIFNTKPKKENLNVLIVSNSSIQIPITLGEFNSYQNQIEEALIPILDKARRDDHIRIKAYRIKKIK